MGMTESPNYTVENEQISLLFGLSLALISCLFIGASFVIKKVSLIHLGLKGNVRAGSGGYGYLKDWLWWLGLLTMGIGELANFGAYTLAPASLITPLGALSVLVSTVLASKFLKERLSNLGKIGCFLCILGSVIIILHAPKERQVESISELLERLHQSDFINFMTVLFLTVFVLIFFIGPRYGNRFVLVYITICSCIGCVTVMVCKALGLVIKESLNVVNSEHLMLALTFSIIILVSIIIQMNYLNKTLDLFSTHIVTPIYYVMFTTLVITASAILFNEWQNMEYSNVLGSVCGFLIVFVAIFLLQNFKETECQSTSANTYLLSRSV